MKRDDRAMRRLRELGLIDEAWLEHPEADPWALLRGLQQRAREVRERPSLLGDLGVSSVEVLCCPPEEAPPALAPPGPELTVVFTDLQGFTAFTRGAGDAAASRLLGRHYAVVDDLVSGRGGRVVKRIGDGHLLVFPQPRAAVLAGLDLLEAPPDPLPLRVGEHAGPVVLLDDDVLGHVVNVASRVVGEAEGGHALVTAEVRDRAGSVPGVAFGETRAATLKGIDEPVPVCEARRS